MAHIHTAPGEHDLTASGYIVRIDGPEPQLLLHRHRLLNQLLQYGGHTETDENPWQSVLREIAEEAGYEPGQLQVLQPSLRMPQVPGVTIHPHPAVVLTHPFPGTDHYHTDIGFAFVTSEDPKLPLAKDEVTETGRFTADQLRAIPDGEIPENVRQIGIYVLEVLLPNWQYEPTSTFAVASSEAK